MTYKAVVFPHFNRSQFLRALIDHILFTLFGPFYTLYIICTKNLVVAQNYAFYPRNKKKKVEMALTNTIIVFVGMIVTFGLLLNDKVFQDHESTKLDIFPFSLMMFNQLIRQIIICIRYGSTPRRIY